MKWRPNLNESLPRSMEPPCLATLKPSLLKSSGTLIASALT